MKIISFAWTTAALLAGRKTVTRREWTDNYARRFHRDDLVAAYDRSPRRKGKHVATIRLTEKPYKEPYMFMPDADYEGEGLAFYDENPDALPAYLKIEGGCHSFKDIFDDVRLDDVDSMKEMWVVRFELVEVIVPFEDYVQPRGYESRVPRLMRAE